MKTLFIASGPLSWASSRFRIWWPAEHMPDADVTTMDDVRTRGVSDVSGYETIVIQKHGMVDLQREWRRQGKTVIWDACDPMWWFSPDAVRAIVAEVDAVTVSTPGLVDDFQSWNGYGPRAYLLPDRLNLDHYEYQRAHQAVSPVRFIWYGVSVNRVSLAGAWANLSRLAANGVPIELTLFDNGGSSLSFGNELPVYWQEWSLGHENKVIAAHDIALLPPYPGPWGQVKSNNKVLTAAACGLPVTDGYDYDAMHLLATSPEWRATCAVDGYRDLENWNVTRSAVEWERIIQEVRGVR